MAVRDGDAGGEARREGMGVVFGSRDLHLRFGSARRWGEKSPEPRLHSAGAGCHSAFAFGPPVIYVAISSLSPVYYHRG